jgi:FkbM family methyltransferase
VVQPFEDLNLKTLRKYIAKYGWLGFKLYIFKKIKFPRIINICMPHLKDIIILRSSTSDIDVFEQIFIDEEYKFITDTEPNVIIDAGANIGLASVYYSTLYPHAKIIAIEPETSNFELLKENVKSYPNIYIIKAGIWNTNTYLKISNPGDKKFAFMLEESHDRLDIEAITIDELIEQHGLHYIDILKLDIEGAEKEIFSNYPSWISKVGMIVIELHDKIKVGCNRAFYTATDPFVIKEFRRGENVFVITCCNKIQNA